MDRGASEDVPVLIVGGSLVGLSAALFLRWHGVEVLAVERHAGTAITVRAGHFHLRTVEILRSGGPGDRELLPEPQRRGRGVQPDGAAIHQPGRARADPAHPGPASSALGCDTAPSARRWSRTRTASRRSSAI